MPATMVPPPEALPDVLPTDRLLANGKAVPAIRQDLRRIADLRNVGTIIVAWGQIAATMGVALWARHPLVWLASFVLMGPAFARFAILSHEAAHKLLFTNKAVNDWVGRWLCSYIAFVPMDAYRRSHFAHHRDEFGPEEPDMNLYVGYPITPDSLKRKLWRDLRGTSGRKNLQGLIGAVRSKTARPIAIRIVYAQAALFVVLTTVGVLTSGAWWLYLWWLGPWMTIWRVINRLRAIAEHGGMTRSDDRRETTHHVRRQSWLARFWIVPLHTGWHLAHHVDMGVPWRNLPKLHAELERAGWVTDANTYPNYRSLWRALSSGQDAPARRDVQPAAFGGL
jgi:fatty acid desaturase